MIFTRWGVYKAEADSTRQHAHILNSMLDEYHNIVGEEEVGGERDEDSTAVGGRNAATAGVSNAPLCVHNYWTYGRVDTELSGVMAPASTHPTSLYFYRKRICNTISVDGIGSPGHVEELNCRSEE